MANNAFNWNDGTPSIFANIKSMQPTNKGGLTKSQACTQSVEKRRQETGICPGSISGLSAAGDNHIGSFSLKRKAKA